jgi:ARG and Rhodanese-Phosphatase-superfamily-associated Protein domain
MFRKGTIMRIWSVAPLTAVACAAFGAAGSAFADTAERVSGPYVHENLAIYFVHGPSAAGAVPLTLTEAMAKGRVQVFETGQVNELKIENTGDEEVFIQAGDMVKGGRQDRVLMVSLVLPPRSGQVPIASFCVEPGRWSARGSEDAAKFSSASEAMPSRKTLAIMAAPPAVSGASGPRPAGGPPPQAGNETAIRQRQVWDEVAKMQADLSAGVNARVAAPQSASSLQLALEHKKLKEARQAYVAALEPTGLKDSDVIGYVAAINGRTVSANIYPSNGLFQKMWGKQLTAAVTEAIGERPAAPAAPPPPTEAAQAFLKAAEEGAGLERETVLHMRQETREHDGTLYSVTRRATGGWLHKNYLAK